MQTENKYSIPQNEWSKLDNEGQVLFNKVYEASLRRRKEFTEGIAYSQEQKTSVDQAITKAIAIVSFEAVQQLQPR